MWTSQCRNDHIRDLQRFDIWSLCRERGENSRAAKKKKKKLSGCPTRSKAAYPAFDIGTFSNFPLIPIISSSASNEDTASASIDLCRGMSFDIELIRFKEGYTHLGLNFSGTAGSLTRTTCWSSSSSCEGDALRRDSLVMTRGMWAVCIVLFLLSSTICKAVRRERIPG